VFGVLVWLPTEDQGPGVYPIQVCVTDADHPDSAIECIDLPVEVLENNAAPVLDPIDSVGIKEGVPVQFTATAYDLDRPAQKLTFSLDEGAPFGATIDPITGVFTWTPNPTQATVTSLITVRVTDDGSPPKSAAVTFTATSSNSAPALRLNVQRLTAELITVCVEGGAVGTVYNLESAVDLSAPSKPDQWTVLQTIWKGADNYCETTHSIVSAARFYRVRRVQ
jgi:hypothetical protein